MSSEFTLEIDGHSIPTDGVSCHAQRDPYPSAIYVLNTIDSIGDDGDFAIVSGQCSPFCKTLPCPNCNDQIWVNWMFDYCREFSPDSSQCVFTCKHCNGPSNVLVDGSRVQFVVGGTVVSECEQPALKSTADSDGLHLRLGSLKWSIAGDSPVA